MITRLLLPLLAIALLTGAAKKPVLSVSDPGVEPLAIPTMKFTVYPQKGPAPLTSKITWSSGLAVSCTASGSYPEWQGDKSTSGTQNITFTTKGKLVLTCYGTTPDVTVTWLPPTTNTDGTPITNLAGFNLYVSPLAENVTTASPIVINNPTVQTHIVPGLPVGWSYFAMTAYNTNSAQSAFTGTVSHEVPAQAIAMQRWITITVPPPSPPTEVYVDKDTSVPPTGDGT